MGKFFPDSPTFDVGDADMLVMSAWAKLGLTATNNRHGEHLDTGKIGARLAEIFKANHVIKDRQDLKANGPTLVAWKDALAEELFGDEFLLHQAQAPEEEAARDLIVGQVWEYASVSLTSPLNKALSEMDGYVLLAAKVARKTPSAGKKGVPLPTEGRFLTTDLQLVLSHSVEHGILAYRRATERFEAQLKELGYRQPNHRLAIAKLVAKGLPSIHAALAHADVKSISATMAAEGVDGADDEDEDDDSFEVSPTVELVTVPDRQ